MNAMSIDYNALNPAALIKIFELADFLKSTPKEAAKMWLMYEASKQTDDKKALQPA